ncbi:hypothetical protein Leryth_025251 [Lithospermum erythrorhizon]|nr:hypothetical protein Leryth_025251 [Lithospermum erythrorhizon]
MEYLRKSSENYQSLFGVLSPLKYPFDPYRTPRDHENYVAWFPEHNVSYKEKVLAFQSDSSPHMESQPKLNISSIFPDMTCSFQINESSGLLKNSSSQINHPSTTLELKPMNISFAEVDVGQKKTDIMNKTKDMPLFERLLERLVENYGVKKWSQIARRLTGREGKQCRERWHNHLRPDIKKDSFTEEEEQILVDNHKQLGNKWSKIANKMPGRGENSIKNHFYATKRKMLTSYRNKKNNNNTTTKNNNNSPLQRYIRSVISDNVSVEGRPLFGPTLQTPNIPKSPKCSLVKNEVNDQLVPTHCNGERHFSVSMESPCSREEGSTSMPKDWLYGYKPVEENTGTELCNEKQQSDSKKNGFVEFL